MTLDIEIEDNDEEEEEEDCQPQTIVRCTDPATLVRRRRFAICKENVLCCLCCPLAFKQCKFVCGKALLKPKDEVSEPKNEEKAPKEEEQKEANNGSNS